MPHFNGLNIIIKLLSPNAAMDDLLSAMDALLLAKHLGVFSCEEAELIIFLVQDIKNKVSTSKNTGPFVSKLLQRCMGYIIEYAKHGTLDESSTITHIVQVVQAASLSAMELGNANPREDCANIGHFQS